MARYCKPNKATILCLNHCFDFIKSYSITIAKTGNGTGYTSGPILVIRSASHDGAMGTGAVATVAAPALSLRFSKENSFVR